MKYEKVRVAYDHPPSHSCGEQGDPSGPQTRMDQTEGAFGPLFNFLMGLLGEYYTIQYILVQYSTTQYSVSASRKVPKDPKNPLRFFLSHFIWLPQEAYWEVREGAKGPLSWVHTSLGTRRVPQPSAGARRRVAVGHPNLLVL